MMKIKYLSFAILAACVLGCQQEPDSKELYNELVVSTNYDPEANFGAYSTYAIPTDTIGLITNVETNDTLITAQDGSSFPRPVLSAIRSAMEARGYTRVAHNENPDLGVNVVVVNDFNVFQQVVYANPYAYNNYYSGYYGYNSWYYYPYVNTYVSNTGVLIIELVDLKNKTPDNKVRVIWDAYLGDVYSTIKLIDQTTAGIDQAFLQSPYIGKAL